MPKFDDRELGAILAGLRLVQSLRTFIYAGMTEQMRAAEAVLTSEGEIAPLTDEEIDDLCVRLNADGAEG